MTEGKMVGWHHQVNRHEYEQTLEYGNRESWCANSPWGHKESDMAERLNNNDIQQEQLNISLKTKEYQLHLFFPITST